jgi:hypothetical protein
MSHRIFDSFSKTEHLVSEFVAGCGKKYGMHCTAGQHCFCKSGISEVQSNSALNDMTNSNQGVQSHQQPLQGNPEADEPQPFRDGTGRNTRVSMRMSLGGLIGRHSLTSNTTFGRAMSGLSALSIDWENMDDFDINVDHSEGINNDMVNQQKEQENADKLENSQQEGQDEGYGEMNMSNTIQRVGPRTARRSSLRNPIMNTGANMNVSFDM